MGWGGVQKHPHKYNIISEQALTDPWSGLARVCKSKSPRYRLKWDMDHIIQDVLYGV